MAAFVLTVLVLLVAAAVSVVPARRLLDSKVVLVALLLFAGHQTLIAMIVPVARSGSVAQILFATIEPVELCLPDMLYSHLGEEYKSLYHFILVRYI